MFTLKQVDDSQDEEMIRGFYGTDQKRLALDASTGRETLKVDLKKEEDEGEKERIQKSIDAIEKEARALFKEEGIFFGQNGLKPKLGLITSTHEAPKKENGDPPDRLLNFRVINAPCHLGSKVRCTETEEGKERPGCEDIAPDVIVIHEGTLDMIHEDKEVKWAGEKGADEDEKQATRLEHIRLLWEIAPCVVRTSGRGRHTRHLREELPFIEFGEVSGAILTSRNKYSLARALLGTSGGVLPPSEESSALTEPEDGDA